MYSFGSELHNDSRCPSHLTMHACSRCWGVKCWNEFIWNYFKLHVLHHTTEKFAYILMLMGRISYKDSTQSDSIWKQSNMVKVKGVHVTCYSKISKITFMNGFTLPHFIFEAFVKHIQRIQIYLLKPVATK